MNVQGDYEPADATGFININSLRSVGLKWDPPQGGQTPSQGLFPFALGVHQDLPLSPHQPALPNYSFPQHSILLFDLLLRPHHTDHPPQHQGCKTRRIYIMGS